MSESRVFMLNGTEVEKIVACLEGFFRNEKGMEVQSSRTAEGFVMQASQPKDTLKTLTGMRLALTVQMSVMGDQLNVSIGEGQWTDKIGAGAAGLFVAWPLAITAGIGAFKQKKLPEEVFQVISNTIMTGGQSVVVPGVGLTAAAGMIPCPSCGAQLDGRSKFCNHCGAKLVSKCPDCGADVKQGSTFCSECGARL